MSDYRLPPDEIALWSDRARGEVAEAMRALHDMIDNGNITSVEEAFHLGQAYERMRSAEGLMKQCQMRANHFASMERSTVSVVAEAARFVMAKGQTDDR